MHYARLLFSHGGAPQMLLIDVDCREDPVGLLKCEIASIKFSGNIWMSHW